MLITESFVRRFVRDCLRLNEDARTASAIRQRHPFIGDDAAAMLSQAVWRIAADISRAEALKQNRQENPDEMKPVAKNLAQGMEVVIDKVSAKAAQAPSGKPGQPGQPVQQPGVQGSQKPGIPRPAPKKPVQPPPAPKVRRSSDEEREDEGLELDEEHTSNYPLPTSIRKH